MLSAPRFDAAFVADALAAPTATAVRRRVFAQLVSSLLFEGVLPAAPVRAHRAHGFGRVRLDEPVGDHTSFAGFLRDTGVAAEPHRTRFARELERTHVHDALAQHARTLRGDVLAGAAHDDLEGLVTDGHRYHPAYKSRVGFDVADDLAFGPEFLPDVRPLWLAVREDACETSDAASLTPGVGKAPSITAPRGFVAVAVHPWQWREVLVHRYADRLADGGLRVLGEDPHRFTPTQSIRTLTCRDDPARPQLKLALDITTTSTSRGLAPHTVANAAPVSDWLAGLAASDPLLRERMVLLREVRGVSVAADPSFGCLWRESLHPRLAPGEAAVPGTALHARERDGTPFVVPWLRAHGTEAWVRAFAEAVVVPLVHLLTAHGIAAETHAQNTSLCHRDGWPVRVVVRDLHDGVRFRRSRLADPAAAPALRPPPPEHPNANSFLETDDDAQVVGFLLDAVLAVNVGELALLLDEDGLLAEERFWALVTDAVVAHHRGLTAAPRHDVFVPTFAMEKLTTRRLGADTALAEHTVPNPLARR